MAETVLLSKLMAQEIAGLRNRHVCCRLLLPRELAAKASHGQFFGRLELWAFPLFTIARWVGHSNTMMIEKVYAHLLPDYSAREMGKLDLGLDSVPTPTNTGSTQGSPENEKCAGSAEKAPKKSPEANIIAFATNS